MANLLGRTPYAAAALVSGAVAAGIGCSHDVPARLIAWLLLMLAAVAALAHRYRHTLHAPFERGPLRAFAQDLNVVMLYAGFAWGTGAFLIFWDATPLALALFSAGMPGLMALLLRSAKPMLCFVAPVAALTVISLTSQPHPGNAAPAALVIAISAAAAAASLVLERRSRPRRPALADLPAV